MRELFVLNPLLSSGEDPVVIVGTGRMALLVHTCLIQEGIEIAAFCDPSEANAGLTIMGRPVVTVDALRVRWPTAQIVWAGEDPSRADDDLAALQAEDAWIDLRAFDIVNDCIWSFM